MDGKKCRYFHKEYVLLSVSMHLESEKIVTPQNFLTIFDAFRFSVSTKVNPHPLLKAASHMDEICYLFKSVCIHDVVDNVKSVATKESDSITS